MTEIMLIMTITVITSFPGGFRAPRPIGRGRWDPQDDGDDRDEMGTTGTGDGDGNRDGDEDEDVTNRSTSLGARHPKEETPATPTSPATRAWVGSQATPLTSELESA